MSDYFKTLKNQDVAQRYVKKIQIINGIDPYSLDDTSLSFASGDLPITSAMDIMVYLVYTTSHYTGLQMKSYKSLEAFKYFEAGFVLKIGVKNVLSYKIVVGKIKHSQRMNNPPLTSWIIAQDDGSIITGHCTCMAGLGEVCSHIGALLFAVEHIQSSQKKISCTDLKSTWRGPSNKKVLYEEVDKMEWNRNGKSIVTRRKDIPALKKEEIHTLIQAINKNNAVTVLEKVIEPFASKHVTEVENLLPNVLNLFNPIYLNLQLSDLVKITESMIVVQTKADCLKIMKDTVGQASNTHWFKQRAGRITASVMKDVCNAKLNKPSLTLVKKICYPTEVLFKCKQTQWGIKNEKKALKYFLNEFIKSHSNVQTHHVGLCIDPEYPVLAASPDAIIECACCGLSCVEIKCPFSFKTGRLSEYLDSKYCCLENKENIIRLKEDHAYFHQVQTQMAIMKTNICHFVVWGPTDMHVEAISFDAHFWKTISEKAIKFHKEVVLPELMGKVFTRA